MCALRAETEGRDPRSSKIYLEYSVDLPLQMLENKATTIHRLRARARYSARGCQLLCNIIESNFWDRKRCLAVIPSETDKWSVYFC